MKPNGKVLDKILDEKLISHFLISFSWREMFVSFVKLQY